MKLISWNVNGLRACIQKGFYEFMAQSDAHFLCLQETKMHPTQAEVLTPGYHQTWCSALRKGYSGTAIFSRMQPLDTEYEMNQPQHTGEGRVIAAEFPSFFLVTAYSPNSQEGLKRLSYRMEWEDAFRRYVQALDTVKPVVICGDLNVAHNEIDLKNPKSNRGSAGFSDEERSKMTELLSAGFTDTFRFLHPDATGAYSWWSYRYNARKNNAGWRIDYFLVSNRLQNKIRRAEILSDVLGSDHCPVLLELDMEE